MRHLRIIFAVLAAAGAFSCGEKPREEGELTVKLKLKVMSFNVRVGGKEDGSTDEPGHEWATVRKEAVMNMFEDIDPDIAILQEARQEQLADFEERLQRYAFYRYACDGLLKDGYSDICTFNVFLNNGARNVIMLRKERYSMTGWGRFWLSETPDEPSAGFGTGSKKVVLWLKVRDFVTKKEFFVFDVHFITPGKGDVLSECASLLAGKAREITASGPEPVFVAGDFNCDEGDGRIAPFTGDFLSARALANGSDQGPTYNKFSEDRSDWKRLDHIFFLHAEPVSFKVISSSGYGTAFISDHWPVVAEFVI